MKKWLIPIFLILLPFFRVKFYYSFWFWASLVIILYLLSNKLKPKSITKDFSDKFDFLLFLLFGLISSLISGSFLSFYHYFAEYSLAYILYLVFKDYLYRSDSDKNYSKALLAAYILVCFTVVMQFLGYQAFYFSDVDNLNGNTNFEMAANVFEIRFWGPFSSVLILSNFLVSIGLYLFATLFVKKFASIYKLLFFLVTLLFVLGTGSRTGLIIYMLGSIGILLSFVRIKKFKLVAILVMLFFLIYSLDAFQGLYIFQRFQSLGADARYAYIQSFPMLFSENPILGCGIWNLNTLLQEHHMLPDFVGVNYATTIGHIENVYLTVMLSVGVVGGFFFIRFLLMTLFKGLKRFDLIKTEPSFYAYTSIILIAFSDPSLIASVTILVLMFFFKAKLLNSIYDLHRHPGL